MFLWILRGAGRFFFLKKKKLTIFFFFLVFSENGMMNSKLWLKIVFGSSFILIWLPLQLNSKRLHSRMSIKIAFRLFFFHTDFFFTLLLSLSSIGKFIISERALPPENRTIKPVKIGGVAGGDK